jgi:hypothetical protein
MPPTTNHQPPTTINMNDNLQFREMLNQQGYGNVWEIRYVANKKDKVDLYAPVDSMDSRPQYAVGLKENVELYYQNQCPYNCHLVIEPSTMMPLTIIGTETTNRALEVKNERKQMELALAQYNQNYKNYTF